MQHCDMTVCRASTFARVLISSVLVVGAQNAAAIGDSGGCTVDINYQRLLSHGSVAEVAAHIEARVTTRAAYIENERKKKWLAASNPKCNTLPAGKVRE